MHLTENQIRAYIDGELTSQEIDQFRLHLDSCARCRQTRSYILVEIEQIGAQIGMLTDPVEEPPISENEALALLNSRIQNINQKENQMFNKISSALPRPAWVALVVLALLIASMAFAPLRAVADSFLKLFRVEQVRVVEFDMEDRPADLGASSEFEFMMSNQVQVQEQGEPIEVANASEASALSGFAVRLPSNMEGKYKVTPGGDITFNVDLEQVRTVLKDIGLSDIELPESIDGAVVSATIQPGVSAEYGDCNFEQFEDLEEGQTIRPEDIEPVNCTTLVQLPNPVIEAPANLEIDKLGEAYLQLTGMSPEEAAEFSRSVDWATTLVIPVPRYGTEHEQVQVDGVSGTFINHYEYKTGDMYLLVWIRDGIAYALSGPGDKSDALQIVDSLE